MREDRVRPCSWHTRSCQHGLADGLKTVFIFLVERSAIVDLEFGVVETCVARHHGSRSIIVTDNHRIPKRVADEQGMADVHALEGI